MLQDRRSECGTLDRLLEGVRAGRSGVLVVCGEPGVGKSALLDYVVEQAADLHAVRAAGVQSEMELPFAGLHQLCAPLLERLDRLPGPQRDALGVAFGLRVGPAPDRFRVGLAVLSLLSEVAAERPLVCVVDDAHWLDRASVQALAFVARRLVAESVGLLFAAVESGGELAGLPELAVEGLRDGDARALLGSALRGPLDERVRDRIVAETRGNPLALLEWPRGVTAAELAGGFGLPDASPLSGQIEESFRRRLEALPVESQRLLLVAAAEPVGEPVLVWRAAEGLGIDVDAAAAHAAEAGLLEFGARVRFRHPLVRSAVYRAASLQERQAAHRALAEATDREEDPDRRAWHRAQAAAGPDEEVAEELERSAGRAQARGGPAAAAAFLERAAGLTLDPARRAARALAAAQAKYDAGAPDAALELLATAQAGPLDELQCARVDVLRAQIASAVSRSSDAPPLLLEAAKRLESLDARLARETYLDALWAAMFAGRLARGVREVAEAALAAGRAGSSAEAPRACDLVLDGLAVLITEGHAAAAPLLRRALGAFRGGDITREEEIRWLNFACRAAADLWDDETRHVLSTRHVELARDAGALTVLPVALSTRIAVHLTAGELTAAAALIEEIEAVTEATGIHLQPYGALALAALEGREAEASELIEVIVTEVMPGGEGIGLSAAQWATAVLCNGLGRYEQALGAAEQAGEYPEELLLTNWALIELIEAAARSGHPDRAAPALRRLSEATRAAGTEWALGIEARSRALLSEDDAAAEPLYREAIERLGRTRVRVELARAHLLYGEWLRRENRRLDAREHLRTAHELLTAMGMGAFAQRAARELLATGEHARKRSIETSDQLTAREVQIARLASEGLSNTEIAARLFLSPRTVEYHLTKIFAKLDISSRHQLHRVLSSERDAAQPV
ncbi:MAG TPA: AAA family ATPase [Solirubrobacteraceae bacterium]|nr:AAA family ATPase [Solirubrobacteraceae bacterium]